MNILASITTVERIEQRIEKTDAIVEVILNDNYIESAINDLHRIDPDRYFRFSSNAIINGRKVQFLVIQLYPDDQIFQTLNIGPTIIFVTYARLVGKMFEKIENVVDEKGKSIEIAAFTLTNYIHSIETLATWGAFKGQF